MFTSQNLSVVHVVTLIVPTLSTAECLRIPIQSIRIHRALDLLKDTIVNI